MAGLGGRAAAHLTRHLARLRVIHATRSTQGHAASLHTTAALDAGVFGVDEDGETGSYMEGLLEALTDMGTHYTPDVREGTAQPRPGHHTEAGLGREQEATQTKHNTGLPGVSVAPVVSSSDLHSCDGEEGGDGTETENLRLTSTPHLEPHKEIDNKIQNGEQTSAVDHHSPSPPPPTIDEEMVQRQKNQLESTREELPSVEDLKAAPEHADSRHEEQSLPMEVVSPVHPHPLDLALELTQVQENLETFAADVTHKTADVEEYYEASEMREKECVDGQEGGAGCLAALGTSSVPQVPDDSKDIKVGTVIALMVAEGEDWKEVEMPSGVEDAGPSSTTTTTTTEEATKKAAEGEAGHGNYGPSVRLLLEQYGLREEEVPHGGPHGILVKGDVLRLIKERNLQAKAPEAVPPPEAPKPAAAAAAPSQPPPPPSAVAGDGYIDLEVTSMRRTIAKRLTQSKSGIAHSYATMECHMDSLLELRKQYKAEGVNVSVNDLIIKAVAVALGRCPEMNCVWQGDQLKTGGQVDVSVAVATPAGLITPIVRGADTRGLEDIAATVRDLATRAKENKLKLDEFQGGTFTISNLGMFGIREFSAIINPPQCGILAVGGSRLVPDDSGAPVTLMASQLSYDRAAVDDLVAAEFLSTLKTLLENPKAILLGSYASTPHPLAALL